MTIIIVRKIENGIDFVLYDKNADNLSIINDGTFVLEIETTEPQIIGSCFNMAYILLKENYSIEKTIEKLIEKLIENSADVAGKANIKIIKKND